MSTKNSIEILDTTLRDGSYTIGYQFSLQDNIIIASGLEKAGVNLIEIGHGTGLGSSRADNSYQAYTDQEYMMAVSHTLNTSEYGFFFIPSIGSSEDLNILADHNGGFIRIGVSIENYDSAKKYIELAKKLKIKFWINLMKSYIYSFDEFAEFSKRCFNDGSQGLYLVDSAGGMLPHHVSEYMDAAKEELDKNNAVDFSLGFHGHENLSLGVACALAAVQSGAEIIDGSLLGIGRSIGNSPIETLGMVLNKAGYKSTLDPWKLSDLSNKTIKPYLENRWRHSSIEQALGYKEIHSSFLDDIESYALEKEIDLRDLILSLPNNSRRSINIENLEIGHKNLRKLSNKNKQTSLTLQKNFLDKELSLSKLDINDYLKNLSSQAQRTNRKSVLLFSPNWHSKSEAEFSIQKIKSTDGYEIGSIDFHRNIKSVNINSLLLEKIDFIIYDINLSVNNEIMECLDQIDAKRIFRYSDKSTVFSHLARYLSVISNNYEPDLKIYLHSDNTVNKALEVSINNYSLEIIANPSKADVHVLISNNGMPKYEIQRYKNLKSIVDVRSSILNDSDVSYAISKNIDLVAIDFESAVVSEVVAIIENNDHILNQSGDLYIDNLRLVAKGKWGNNGDIVVDKIPHPTSVIGVSDGLGRLKNNLTSTDNSNINKIITYIINQ